MSDDWRKDVPIHKDADLFPMMSNEQLDALASDIAKNGLQRQVVWLNGELLDGRNRLAAIARIKDAARREEIAREAREGAVRMVSHPDPIAYVVSANIHRRHLTAAQKRELIATL